MQESRVQTSLHALIVHAACLAMVTLDRFDLQLLALLQRDGRATAAALGERVGLSASQVGRRIQRLEAEHVIERCVMLLRPAALGLGVTAYTRISLERHAASQTDALVKAVRAMPEVLECHAVTGQHDYLLRIVAPDLEAFSRFMNQKLMRVPGVHSMESSIVLQEIKRTTELPLPYTVTAAAGAAPPPRARGRRR
jgi:Lrp/AsnC family leucine-responsive transcriptional regulator